MTSKPKCPVCGGELVNIIGLPGCTKCNFLGNEYTRKALIRTQKQLEIARKTLKNISLGNVPGLPDDETLANAMCNYARDTLKQIEHKK